MYCVHQLLPPSVYAHATVVTVVDGQLLRTAIVAVQGCLLRAYLIPHCAAAAKLDEEEGATTLEPPQELSSYTLNVGTMVLSMCPCAKGTLLLLTEDNTIALLQLIVEAPPLKPKGFNSHDHAHIDASRDKAIRFQLIFQTPVPMETVVNRPPTIEAHAPVMTPSPCGNLVAFQSYRGWLHVVSVNKALGQLPLEQVVYALQLEKPKLNDACFVTSTMHGNSDSAGEAIFVPVFDRPLQTARGYFISRTVGSSSLVDAVRRWQLPGLPYKSIGLSPLMVPRTPDFTLLDGVDTSSSHAAFVVCHRDVHTLVYTSLLTKRIVERVPNEVRCMAEVLNLSDQHFMGAGLWMLDVLGGLWRSSLLELDEAVRIGDCEQRTVPRLDLVNFPVRAACGPLLYLKTTPAPSATIASALSYSLVVLGDGASVFVVCPHNRMVVRSFLSDGPVVGISDGPRGALVAVTASGSMSMLRSALAASEHLAALDVAGVSSIVVYHPISSRVGSHANAPSSARVFLVTQWQSRTRALIIDINTGDGGIEEVSSREHPSVAPFEEDEATLAASCSATLEGGCTMPGQPLQSSMLVCQVTPSRAMWSTWNGAAANNGGAFSTFAELPAQTLLASVCGNATTSQPTAVFNHVTFVPKRRSDGRGAEAASCSTTTFVAASGPHIVLARLIVRSTTPPTATPSACLLESLPNEVADIACLQCRDVVGADGDNIAANGSACHGGRSEVLVASAGWNELRIRIVRYSILGLGAPLTAPASVHATALVVICTPHVLRSLTYVAPNQLWFNDASGACWRYCCADMESAPGEGSHIAAAQQEQQDGGAVRVVDAAAQANSRNDTGGGSCLSIVSQALSFPVVACVHRDDHDVANQEGPSAVVATATPTVVVLGDQDATVVHTLAERRDTLFMANVQLSHRDDGAAATSPLGGGGAVTKIVCGCAVMDGIEEDDTMLLLTADAHRFFVDVVPPIAPPRAGSATTALRSSQRSSRSTSPPRQVSLRTSLCLTRKSQVPSVSGANDRAVSVLPVGGGTDSDRTQLLVVSDAPRGSTITTVDAATFTPSDAMLLDEHEFVVGVERIPQCDGTLVVVATGVCKLPAPADPTSGRILIVGTSPLRFGARFVTEREACYCMTVCAIPPSINNHTTTTTSDGQGGDAATVVLVAVGLPSQLLMLRLMGDHLIPVVTVPLSAPPSAMSFSYPYVSLSHMVIGTIYFEVQAFDTSRQGDAPLTSAASDRGQAASSDLTFRLTQRCMESFAASNVHVDACYAPQRFLRCDTRRNVYFVALEPRSNGAASGGATPGEASPAVVEDHGGAGITSSPFLPVCVASIRLSGRPTTCYVTHARHSAVGFDVVVPDASSGSSAPSPPPPRHASSSRDADHVPHHRGTVASIRGLSAFNFNTDYEPDFTLASTAPRIIVPCDDGSVYMCCGIASEASRLLARLEYSMQVHLNTHAVLRPRNSAASSTGGFAPAALADASDSSTSSVIGAGVGAFTWCNAVNASLASHAGTTAIKSMVRQASRHGMLDRTLLEHFLTLDDATKRRCVEANEDMEMESSDEVTSEGMAQLVAALTFLD